MGFVTDFADLAVVVPFVLGVAAVFLAASWWRGALWWMGACAGTLAVVGVFKLACLGCVAPGARGFSPSGHTAAACCAYGGALSLLLRRWWAQGRVWLVAGLPFAVLVGASRLELGVHRPLEVVAGGLVGMAGLLVLLRGAGAPPALNPVSRGLLCGLPLVLLLHGTRAPAETALRAFAGWMPARVCAAIEPRRS